jgi:predicted DsbA family dithiol-disulfide isomerase
MVGFVVYSDYLCPWCYAASARLRRVRDEFAGDVTLEWRSYLLRPTPRPGRDLERFRTYTRSWQRPGAEPDSPEFREWQGQAGPPSHSLPPHVVAKAAARVSPEAFEVLHEGLLRAYFRDSRDITDPDTLQRLWAEAGLAEPELPKPDDPTLQRQVLSEHQEALDLGVTGVPAVRLQDNDAFIVGAQPLDVYRRWVTRSLEHRPEA